MMANEEFKSFRENFGEFIYQVQPKIKTLVRKLERIFKNCIDNMCLHHLIKFS